MKSHLHEAIKCNWKCLIQPFIICKSHWSHFFCICHATNINTEIGKAKNEIISFVGKLLCVVRVRIMVDDRLVTLCDTYFGFTFQFLCLDQVTEKRQKSNGVTCSGAFLQMRLFRLEIEKNWQSYLFTVESILQYSKQVETKEIFSE